MRLEFRDDFLLFFFRGSQLIRVAARSARAHLQTYTDRRNSFNIYSA